MKTATSAEKISRRRRLKYGGLAIGITCVVIALVVVVNAIFYALAYKLGLYVDMTEQSVFSITDATRDLLNDYRGKENSKIEIIFCSDANTLDGAYETKLVHNLALEYENEFDFVTVRYVDIINHPDALAKYMSTGVSNPKTTSVIISNGSQSRIYTINSFYTFDSDTGNVFAFNGEYKMTAGILQIIGDNPIAYFVTGHGEQAADNGMTALFEEAGFDVRTIDLSKESPDENAKVMVINAPAWDYLGADDSVNEIKKVSDFVENFGALMVFMGSGTKALPNLDEFLEEWGIRFETAQVRDYSHSLSVDGTELVAAYVTEGTGASLTKTIREMPSTPMAVVKDARPVTTLYTDGHGVYGSSERTVTSVLTTSPDKTATATPLDGQGEAKNGVFNLMTVTVSGRYVDNELHSSYVLAAGTSSFADSKYIGSKSYANRDIVFYAMKNFIKKVVPLDINFKVFTDTELNCTTAEANRYTALFTVVPAAIVAGVGIFVYTRRKYL